MFTRYLEKTLLEAVAGFPVTVLTGPRQSGKTTLLRYAFPDYAYVSLEDPDTFVLVSSDPRGFLSNLGDKPIIIDEAQNYPELFSYLQGVVDERQQAGQFILSGSQNFLLSQHVSQTLAGRAAILELLPLSYSEFLSGSKKNKDMTLWNWLYLGSYPRPYQEKMTFKIWYNSYIKTYLERDVRALSEVKDLRAFQRFIRLCAGRHGQLLNLNQLAQDAGVSPPTAKHWLSILEASYLVFLLQPHYKNFNKRVIKMPKLYFFDSGLVCQLLGIDSPDHLSIHSARGAIFEGFVISEVLKSFYHQGASPPVYFWRDHRGLEVDCLIEKGEDLLAVEIKSSETFRPEMLQALTKWCQVSAVPVEQARVVYAADKQLKLNGVDILSWKQSGELAQLLKEAMIPRWF